MLDAPEDQIHGVRRPLPLAPLGFEILQPRSSDDVVPRPAIVLTRTPFGFHETGAQRPLECRVQRSLIEREDAARDLLDALHDAPAVVRTERERLEDEHLERARKNWRVAGGHDRPVAKLQVAYPHSCSQST